MTSLSKAPLLIGADPELFLVNREGKFISSILKIGGSKARPLDIGEGCAIQEDNVAVEFNIPPASDADAFVRSIDYALEHLENKARDMGLSLSITASKVFDKDQLTHIRAIMFGCETDWNAWTKKPNPRPKPPQEGFRTCGGHVHFGVGPNLDKEQLARWCDVKMGLWSVLEDEDTERRQLYGQAGCFRPKPYGIEYRTLSNFWLKSKDLMREVYARSEQVVSEVEKGRTLSDEDGKLIQHAINTSDKALARELMIHYV